MLQDKIKSLIYIIEDTEINELEVSSFWGAQKIRLQKNLKGAIQSIDDALEQLKQAKGGSDIDAINTAIEIVNKAWEPIAQKMYQAAQQEAQAPSSNSANNDTNDNNSNSSKDGEVEDADFEVVEEEK